MKIRVFIAMCLAVVSLSTVQGSECVSYSRDVRPILSAKCFKCHGPDEENRAAGLRLDQREAALVEADSGLHAIVPGKYDESELVRRITSKDNSERMPPPETNHTLSSAQIETLKRWIAEGAKYEPHWAFIAPVEPKIPEIEDGKGRAEAGSFRIENPIDAFIAERLQREGLTMAPEADRYTLIRRVYLDLIGIPPTPEEADAFVNDTSPGAYERVVDHLLSSPHYGERWARRWLDLARYADTNGYEKDRPRSIWPYRDWVIKALNDDMPFDQFTIEQIAGDMLPGATASQRIATGFHRNTMLNEEGGIDPLEFRHYAAVDRVNTTATVWLGLTLGCAQCHTHKFDPLTHTEYYRMLAFLNNTDEPDFEVPDRKISAQRRDIERQIAALEAKLPEQFPLPSEAEKSEKASTENVAHSSEERDIALSRSERVRRREHAEAAFAAWLAAQRKAAIAWRIVKPSAMKANAAHLELLDDESVLVSGDQTKRDEYELTIPIDAAADVEPITAIRLEVLPHESLPGGGPGRVYYEGTKGDFFLNELTITQAGKPIKFAGASASFANGNDQPEKMVDGDPQTSWSIAGGQGRAQQAVIQLAEPIQPGAPLEVTMVSEAYYSAPLGRFRFWVTSATKAKPAATTMPTEIERLCQLPEDELSFDDRDRLWRYFLSTTPELAEPRKKIDELRDRMPGYHTTLVMKERPKANPRPTFVHHRGEFLQPKEMVTPGVPLVLPQIPAGVTANRLTFARWLVDPQNPLVARVTVNRQWAALFGQGIVKTTEDFGHQGDPPTHPELLDWLAIQFVKQNWSMKAMHRLMVTSATYRQSSHVDAERRAKDPDNKLLSRGPRVRLEGELIRDRVLAAAGLLSKKIGGPSVFPPQPASVANEGTYFGFNWAVSTGEDRYRRSLYTFTKRSAPFAMLQTFDGPSGEACIARRDVSNSPLQALTLMNDEMFVEAAQALGRQLSDDKGDVKSRVTTLFRKCLVRAPDETELNKLVEFYETQQKRFADDSAAAEAIVGEKPINVAERAAWVVTARAVLNLDEMVMNE